jgi:putative flippase GtrA
MVALASLDLHYAIYTGAGYCVAFCNSYLLNGLFTFRVEYLSHRGFLKFATVNSLLLVVVEALQFILIDLISVPELAGVITGAMFYTLVGYILNKVIVYRIA